MHLNALGVTPITIFPLAAKVDKDANFTILTSELYRQVNELKAEN